MQVMEQAAPQTDLVALGRVAHMELQDLLRKRSQMNRRIEVLRKTIRALLGNERDRDSHNYSAVRLTPRRREGITHVCRTILKQAAGPLTRQQITEAIRASHPTEAARYRDLSSVVTAVLRYLLESGEANNTFNEEGHRTWFAVRHAVPSHHAQGR